MTEELRPDPDQLLETIKRNDAQARYGRLRVFFGMAAGVGKTYAMLKAAQDRLKEGVDVVIGTVDTHKRAETEAMLVGLTSVPRKKIVYQGTSFEEMDIDAILARHPQLVLVDELAHTNIPGSRHPKRWHDVVELLDSGIDVYTTVNVQHIESRKEPVEAITGIRVRETVPDSLLERAWQIILIDITPAELLKRLSEGKVYLGEMAVTAAGNFFKEDRLTALREIALRLTAETVDNELQSMITARERTVVWKTTERLMVAVSHSPYSEGLIRSTRRLAFRMDVPWIGVHVDTGVMLTDQDKATLTRNLSLVRELGGEVVSTSDVDVAEALKRVALQRNVTQLIIGRPTRRIFRDLLSGGSVLDHLVRESGSFDVHVLRPDVKEGPTPKWRSKSPIESGLYTYGVVIGVIVLMAIFNNLLATSIGYRAVGFIFLLTVLGMGLFVSIGPVLVGAVLSALIWDYFFIPPYGTFHISAPEDAAMCVAYLLVAVTTGTLTNRIRKRERMLRLREERTRVLYDIVRTMASGRDRSVYIAEVAEKLRGILHGECSVAVISPDKRLQRRTYPPADWSLDDKEWAVAEWVLERGQPAGRSTNTLPSASGRYFPLRGTSETVGVFAFHGAGDSTLMQEEENLLLTVTQQMAITIERQLLRERSRQAERLEESEKLYQTILNTVSHEIRTPLTTIVGAASALQNDTIASSSENRHQLSRELEISAARLNRVVSNLMDMSRLSSGSIALKKDWHDVNDLLTYVVNSNPETLAAHEVVIRCADELPLIHIDFALFEQVFSNLLVNAATYSPQGTSITVDAELKKQVVVITVSDRGPGIPEEMLPRIFDKFYRAPGSPPGGTGIGLAIAKSVVEMHGGTIEVSNIPDGGLQFRIALPVENQPELSEGKDD